MRPVWPGLPIPHVEGPGRCPVRALRRHRHDRPAIPGTGTRAASSPGGARGRAPDGARGPRTPDPGDVGAADGQRAAGHADRPARGARDPGRGDPGGDRSQSRRRRPLVRSQPARRVRRDRRPDQPEEQAGLLALDPGPELGIVHGGLEGRSAVFVAPFDPVDIPVAFAEAMGITAIAGAPITAGADVWGFLLSRHPPRRPEHRRNRGRAPPRVRDHYRDGGRPHAGYRPPGA